MKRSLSIFVNTAARAAGPHFLTVVRGLLAAATIVCAASASAQTDGRVLFLNPTTGDYLVGGVDPGGFFHSTPVGNQSSLIGTTHLVTNNSAILAYDRSSGLAKVIDIDGYGNVAFRPTALGINWNSITGTGGYFLAYGGDGNDGGQAAVWPVKQGGSLEGEVFAAGFSAWTNIVPTDDYLVFYNQVSGVFDAAMFSPVTSSLQQNSLSVANIPTGYAVVAAVNDNVILYNPSSGAYRVVSLYFIGNGNDFPDKRDSGTLDQFYGTILHSLDRVVFYSYGSGDVLVGHLTQAGQLVTDHKSTLPVYTDTFTTGSYICFYNAASGELDVYGLTTGGTLTKRSSQQIGNGYTFSVAAHS